jgi:hypothetical protein
MKRALRHGSCILAFCCSLVLLGTCKLNELGQRAQVLTTPYLEWHDPQIKYTSPDTGAMVYFGASVSICGDYVMVGEYGFSSNAGRVYFLHRDGNTWSLAGGPYNGAAGEFLGYSVSISSDYAIAGAPYYNPGAAALQGEVYFFKRSGTTWVADSTPTATQGDASDLFGYSVAIDGTYAIVGARDAGTGATAGIGAAYAYERSTTWNVVTPVLRPQVTTNVDDFGASAAISGTVAIVGAPKDAPAGNTAAGSAFIYTRSSGGTWGPGSGFEDKKLTASTPVASSNFGRSVSISSGTCLVGAPYQGGAIYFFSGSGSNWSETARLTPSEAKTADVFGYSVAVFKNCAIAGAYQDDVNGTKPYAGAAYFYENRMGTWQKVGSSIGPKVLAFDGAANDYFGVSVALTDSYAIVGARQVQVGGFYVGAIYRYDRY